MNALWLERLLEERLTSVLMDVLGTDRITVLVNAQVREGTDAMKRSEPVLLPGVPVKRESTHGGDISMMRSALGRLQVRKLTITILLESGTSEADKETVQSLAASAVGLNPARGDELRIQEVSFRGKGISWASLFDPSNLAVVVGTLAGGFFLAAAGLFLLDPFRRLPVALNRVDWLQVNRAPVDQQGRPLLSTEGQPLATSAGADALTCEEPQDPGRPFSFVDERNLPNLGLLLRDAPAQDVAIVVGHLPSALAAGVLMQLPEQKQLEVSRRLSAPVIEPERTRALEQEIRRQLDFVIGGHLRLATILESSDESLRERVLAHLESTDAAAAKLLRASMKDLETLLRELTPASVSTLLRSVDTAILAQVLQSLPEDIRTRMASSLSAGAAERFQQEVDLARPLQPARLRQERHALQQTIRRMIKAGTLQTENE